MENSVSAPRFPHTACSGRTPRVNTGGREDGDSEKKLLSPGAAQPGHGVEASQGHGARMTGHLILGLKRDPRQQVATEQTGFENTRLVSFYDENSTRSQR